MMKTMQFNLIDGWRGDKRARSPFALATPLRAWKRVHVAPHYIEVAVLDAAGEELATNRTEYWRGRVQAVYWDAAAVRQDHEPQQAILASAAVLNNVLRQ